MIIMQPSTTDVDSLSSIPALNKPSVLTVLKELRPT